MPFADAKFPERRFYGKLIPDGAAGKCGAVSASAQVILSGRTITNRIWHCSVCSDIHTPLPVLQAYGPQVSGTKCHLLRPGWQSPRNADARVQRRGRDHSVPVPRWRQTSQNTECNAGNGKGVLSFLSFLYAVVWHQGERKDNIFFKRKRFLEQTRQVWKANRIESIPQLSTLSPPQQTPPTSTHLATKGIKKSFSEHPKEPVRGPGGSKRSKEQQRWSRRCINVTLLPCCVPCGRSQNHFQAGPSLDKDTGGPGQAAVSVDVVMGPTPECPYTRKYRIHLTTRRIISGLRQCSSGCS